MRKLRMMAKMARKARFMFIVTGDGRAKYMRDKGLVRGMGEASCFSPGSCPMMPTSSDSMTMSSSPQG